MFRLVTIVVRSLSFDLLVWLVSSYVETKRVTNFSVFYYFLTASTQTPGFEIRSGQSPWEGLLLCCQFGLRLSILFRDILQWRPSEKRKGQVWTRATRFLSAEHMHSMLSIIIYMAFVTKLLNADWLRQRAYVLNNEDTFGNQEGMITWSWLAEHACIKLVSRFKRILKSNFRNASLLSLIYINAVISS